MKKVLCILGAACLLSVGACNPCGELEDRCDDCIDEASRFSCELAVELNEPSTCEDLLDEGLCD